MVARLVASLQESSQATTENDQARIGSSATGQTSALQSSRSGTGMSTKAAQALASARSKGVVLGGRMATKLCIVGLFKDGGLEANRGAARSLRFIAQDVGGRAGQYDVDDALDLERTDIGGAIDGKSQRSARRRDGGGVRLCGGQCDRCFRSFGDIQGCFDCVVIDGRGLSRHQIAERAFFFIVDGVLDHAQ